MFEPYKPGDLVIVCDWPDGKVGVVVDTHLAIWAGGSYEIPIDILSDGEVTCHLDYTVITVDRKIFLFQWDLIYLLH